MLVYIYYSVFLMYTEEINLHFQSEIETDMWQLNNHKLNNLLLVSL